MAPTRQTRPVGHRLAENRQTNTTHEPHVHDPPVAETRRAEIHSSTTAGLRGEDEVLPSGGVGEEGEHEGLQQAGVGGGGGAREVDAAGGVGGLLQEGAGRREGEDVDGDAEALGGEDGVHGRDVLRAIVWAGAEDQDAGGAAAWNAGGAGVGGGVAVGVGVVEGGLGGLGGGWAGGEELGGVGEGEGEGAGGHGCGG